MEFWAGIYGLNFSYDFLKKILNIEKLISFVGILIFFQLVLGNKSYAQISSKQRRGGNKNNYVKKKNWIFFPIDYVFFSI